MLAVLPPAFQLLDPKAGSQIRLQRKAGEHGGFNQIIFTPIQSHDVCPEMLRVGFIVAKSEWRKGRRAAPAPALDPCLSGVPSWPSEGQEAEKGPCGDSPWLGMNAPLNPRGEQTSLSFSPWAS